MKSISKLSVLFIMLMFCSCTAIAGIFKAGVWTGILLVAAVIGLIIFLVARINSNK